MYIDRFGKAWNHANQLEQQAANAKTLQMIVPPPPAAVPWSKIAKVRRLHDNWKEQYWPFLRAFQTFKELFNFIGGWALECPDCMYCDPSKNKPMTAESIEAYYQKHLSRQERGTKLEDYIIKHGEY